MEHSMEIKIPTLPTTLTTSKGMRKYFLDGIDPVEIEITKEAAKVIDEFTPVTPLEDRLKEIEKDV